MNAKSTRRALTTSVISLLICVAMLMGTTFAWFTDSVTSGRNTIVAGNLDVVLEYYNGTNFAEVTDSTKLFNDTSLWEPGHTEVAYLKVSNAGTLALKYQLAVNVFDEKAGTNVANESFNLSDHLVFKVVDIDEATVGTYTRETAQAAAGDVKGLGEYNSGTKTLMPKGKGVDSACVALVVYMPETVGNEANYLTGTDAPYITMGTTLFATQVEYENDSFGIDYDKDAWAEGMMVTTVAELTNAINNANDGDTIILGADIENADGFVINDKDLNIDLNGRTITVSEGASTNNRVFKITGDSVVNIKDGTLVAEGEITSGAYGTVRTEGTANVTIDNVKMYSYRGYGLNVKANPGTTVTINNSEIYAQYSGGVEAAGGTIVLNNTTIEQTGVYSGAAWCSVAIGVNGGGKVVVNSGTYSASTIATDSNAAQGTWVAYVMSSGGTLDINGGTFNGKVANTADAANACGVICADRAAVVNLNGGTFNSNGAILDMRNNVGTLPNPVATLAGGVYSADPRVSGLYSSNLIKVADGYAVTEVDGKFYVAKDGTVFVSDETALSTVLTEATDAGSGDTTIALAGDVELTNAWTPIEVDGYHGAGVVTIEGNGNTIKGLSAPLFAGGFAGKSGIVIKDLTIADSDIVSTSGLGGGAFIDTADSMQVITLDNCHLVNSTVKGERTGGLIGWCSGYAKQNDGPVKTYVTVTNCSVVDSEIIAAGSAGGIAGHPGASDWTWTTIENCVVKNVNILSNDSGSWRTGAVVGTANNGHVVINNVTVEGVTLSQTGKTAPAGQSNLYGRFVPSGTGTLVIDGTSINA